MDYLTAEQRAALYPVVLDALHSLNVQAVCNALPEARSSEGTQYLWPKIKEAIEREPWEADYRDSDMESRSVYLGTIMSNSPSGQVYAPWSAVGDATRDADAQWWEAQEAGASAVGLCFESGEGDPCDIFATEYRTRAD
jgi:hypothetical protein